MNRTIASSIILFIILSSNYYVDACEPCVKQLNFEETVKDSDLIILGQKVADGPSTAAEGHCDPYTCGPDWIEVKIINVLNGPEIAGRLKVNSWDGMCNYGIVVDSQEYIMFLKRRSVEHEDYRYDAVNYGCSIHTYLVQNNTVDFEGKKIAIDEFKEKIKKIIDEEKTK